MIYDAVIFDIDGTLWNASSASAKGWNLGLASLGIHQKVTAEQIESVAGNPYERCIDILLPGQREKHPGLLDALDSYETKVVRSDGGAFYPGVIGGIIGLTVRLQSLFGKQLPRMVSSSVHSLFATWPCALRRRLLWDVGLTQA